MMSSENCFDSIESPTVAAIIPLYNGAKHINAAIAGVLAQTVAISEFIIVDDGSTDDGARIAGRLADEHRIRLVRKDNGGQGSARNRGVAESTSDLIAFLDQDDVWYPNHIQRLVETFVSDGRSDLGWVYSDMDEVDEGGKMVTRNLLRGIPRHRPPSSVNDCLGQDMFILPSTTLVARHAFDAVGGFDVRLRGYEDDDLFYRLFRHGYRGSYIDEPLSQWRIYSGSWSYSTLMGRSRMVYFRKLLDEFEKDRPRGQQLVRKVIAPRFLRSILADHEISIRKGDMAAASEFRRDFVEVSKSLGPRRQQLVRLASAHMMNRRVACAAYETRFARVVDRVLGSPNTATTGGRGE